jgi:hypothetical protein
MNQGTQGYSLTKKTEGRKSRDTVSLICLGSSILCPHIQWLLCRPHVCGRHFLSHLRRGSLFQGKEINTGTYSIYFFQNVGSSKIQGKNWAQYVTVNTGTVTGIFFFFWGGGVGPKHQRYETLGQKKQTFGMVYGSGIRCFFTP